VIPSQILGFLQNGWEEASDSETACANSAMQLRQDLESIDQALLASNLRAGKAAFQH
jgi:hypothetical protein